MLPSMLTVLFLIWAAAGVALGAIFLRTAPAVSLALFGSIIGAVGGFLAGNADGPAEVPAFTAVGASLGLVIAGFVGLMVPPGRSSRGYLRRAVVVVLVATPLAAAALTMLLQLACPLYISGKGSGFCDYQSQDLLGGWVSGVIVAFMFDALFVAGLLLMSAWQANSRHVGTAVADENENDRPRMTSWVIFGINALFVLWLIWVFFDHGGVRDCARRVRPLCESSNAGLVVDAGKVVLLWAIVGIIPGVVIGRSRPTRDAAY